ncbi:hypothetical protein B0H11DRAFT_2260336 [Mycena galericulata]|nr:hypothetical protein B0H11DRAFT_2260336 [Mycena galericulata]
MHPLVFSVVPTVVYPRRNPDLAASSFKISYIDLAEQTLSVCLGAFDSSPRRTLHTPHFFSIAVQRTALQAASDCCRNVSPDPSSQIHGVWPILIIADGIAICLVRLAEVEARSYVAITDGRPRHNLAKGTVTLLEEEKELGVPQETTRNRDALRRGRSLLAREEDIHESGLVLFKPGATLRFLRSHPPQSIHPRRETAHILPRRLRVSGAIGEFNAGGTFDGTTDRLFVGGWNLAGNAASFLFQNVNRHYLGQMTKSNTSQITGTGEALDWYFACNIYSQYGTTMPNTTAYGAATNCHVTVKGQLTTVPPQGQVYCTWDDVRNGSRSLALLSSKPLRPRPRAPKLARSDVKPAGSEWAYADVTVQLMRLNPTNPGHCLQNIVTAGPIDTNSIGVASQVFLYLSLTFIVGVVLIHFTVAVMFARFFSWKIGTFPKETYEQQMLRKCGD